jgi:PEGA domain
MQRESAAEPEKPAVASAPIAIIPHLEPGDTPGLHWNYAREAGDEDNSLTSFKPESRPVKPAARRSAVRTILVGLLLTCLAVPLSWLGWQMWMERSAAATPLSVAPTGTAVITSLPEGASITIDGVARGTTPLRVSLAPGSHSVQITSGSASRTLPVTVEAGNVVSQYVELAVVPPVLGGRLEIGSEPSGAEVRVDGVAKGVTPLVINDVPAGQHRVTVSAGDNVVNRTVSVTRGATSTIVVSTARVDTEGSGGWLTIDVPIAMEILEAGRVLGTTRTDRLMLPVGSHRLEFANTALEFTTTRTVQIAAGRTASVAISLPSGRLSVNAVPWADVSINGSPVGTTPLGQLSVPIGTHEVVFRHPQLGERRQSVTVKAQTPTRIGIDLRK